MTGTNLLRNLREPITRKIVILVVLFFGALGLLLAQHHVAHRYTSRCQEALDNQHAKRSLGWIIRKRLVQAESALHQLATEDDARNVRVLHDHIAERVASIENAVTVLSNGGVYEHVIRINFENTDEFRETISYAKDRNEGIVLEAIELVPKLMDLEHNVEELADAVRKRTVAEDDTSRQAFSDRIALHRKQAEATLLRCGETSNKIHRDTSQELAAIERRSMELAGRVRLAEYATAGILGLLCVVVAGITLRQIAGILEERKGLLGDLRKHRDHLDELVTERTTALSKTNEQLQQEVTERKQAEEALRESEERLKALLNANPTGIVVIDAETHEIVDANPVAVNMIGASKEQVLGRKCHKFICPAESGQCPITDLGQEVDNSERVLIRADGEEVPILKTVVPIVLDGRECLLESFIDLTERKRAEQRLRESEERHRAITETAQDAVITADAEGSIRFWNTAAEKIFGFSAAEAVGKNMMELIVPPQYHEAKRKGLAEFGHTGHGAAIGQTLELTALRKDGTEFLIEISLSGYKRGDDFMAVALIRDITERRSLESQLVHVQKMESIGQLAAGIAHEINTPIQYVGDNVRFLSDSMDDLLRLLGSYRDLISEAANGTDAENCVSKAATLEQEADLPYLEEELPKSIAQSLDGVGRVTKIVRAMKDLSHPGSEGKEAVDLNKAIESTITVARNEWKYVAEMVTEFDPALPPVPCLVGDFNQVILNIVINAAHAIAGVVGDGAGGKGTITVGTRRDGDWAEVCIRDTGTGIPEEHRSKVFDHFFTTKEVGKGTGQGLAIAHAVITEKHGGTITLESELGQGTTFIIRLPIESEAATVEEIPQHEEARSLR